MFRDVYLNGGILSYENGNQRCYGKNDKEIWWQMIQLLPSSYNQTRNVMMNYEVLANIYKSRKDHKLDEWRSFCKWIEDLPYSELITGGTNEKWRKYILCILIVTICGSILSFIRNESVLICDIYVMMGILLFEKMED